METDERYVEIKAHLAKLAQYVDSDIVNLKKQLHEKEAEVINYKEQLENAQNLIDGNRQLINKLLGDLSKLQNDIEWYKRTYEQRSFLGTIREKIFRKKY